jgi:putative ABC transport system permease protein
LLFIFRELLRHKWRTLAGIAGYAIATLFIVLVISVNLTNDKSSFGILKGTGTHFIVYIPTNAACCVSCDKETSDGSLVAEGVNTLMLNDDLLAFIKRVDGVRDAAPYMLYSLYDPKLQSKISLGGIDTGSVATRNNVCAKTNLIAGKFMSDNPDEVIAEESFALAHKFEVGDTLKTYGSKLVIAGIINSGIKPGKADLYAPIENVRRILQEKLKCISPGFDMNIVVVEVTDARIQPKVMKQIREKMAGLSVSSYNCYQPASDVMNIMSKTTSALTILIFIFLLIFSAKTQLTSLMERFREVGILKSLGWSNSRLGWQIVSISVIQALIGAIVGIALGLILVWLLSYQEVRLFDVMEFRFQTARLFMLVLLALAGGLIAAVFPVIRLCRTKAGDMINNFM